MGVTALNQDQMGTMTHASIELDPRYAKDFNRLKVSFVGHYRKVCENPASDTLWLNVNRDSKLTLQLQTLPVRNELSFFPMPFLDVRDNGKLTLPMVFTGSVPPGAAAGGGGAGLLVRHQGPVAGPAFPGAHQPVAGSQRRDLCHQ